MPLPDAVMQGLGWAPPPVDDSHHAMMNGPRIAQALGENR